MNSDFRESAHKEESLKLFRHSKIYNKYRKYNLYIYVYCWKIIFAAIGIEKKNVLQFFSSHIYEVQNTIQTSHAQRGAFIRAASNCAGKRKMTTERLCLFPLYPP